MDEILDEKTYETRKVEYVNFIMRTAAFLLDVLIFFAITFGLNLFLKLAPDYIEFLKLYYWKMAIIFFLYIIYFDGSEPNATLGKQIMNIRMLSEHQRDIDFMDSAKHFFLSLVLFFGYTAMLLNDKKQTLADKICKVIVVKVK